MDDYRDSLAKLLDMARGDVVTRIFLATDDPAAEAALRATFVNGLPLPAADRSKPAKGHMLHCLWQDLLMQPTARKALVDEPRLSSRPVLLDAFCSSFRTAVWPRPAWPQLMGSAAGLW